MKIKSLLAAVSMVALSAASAHAIQVTQPGTEFAAPLALELNLAANPVDGNVVIDISPDNSGLFNQGVQHTVVMTLPAGMTFNTNVSGNALVAVGATSNSNIFSGGVLGGNTVTFQISTTGANSGTFQATLPVRVSSCLAEGSGIQATVQTPGGFVNNDTDGDNSASGTAPGFGGCKSAWAGVVNGTTASGADTVIALMNPVYTTIAGDANLGTVTYAIDPAVSKAASLTPIALSDVTNVVSTITLAGNPAMNGATLTAIPGTLTGGPVTWTLTQTAAEATSGSQIDITAGTAVLPNMQPVVGPATSNFVTANGFIANEPGATGNLEAVQRQGQTFGTFDWNAGPANPAPTVSVYRVTGLAPNDVVAYSAEVTNSTNNGIINGSLTADANGTTVFTSTTLPGIPAGITTYDFSINLETGNTNVDIDRLLLRNGVVSAFGDGSNLSTPTMSLQPNNDADSGSE